ncbi:hypothetical protein AB4238_21485, partial [Shewanella sp. 10N.286.45.A1]|uniref:hypothetical protein n=1 Tax=Shewanella sp. 10N.286.45.A1 TaxID=3229694 RepID=UPI00354FFF71
SGATDGFKTRKSAIDVETTGITWFTGNDTLILSQDGAIVDIFGKFGEDPGSAGWTDGSNPDFTTSNTLLRRKANVTTGVTDITADFPGSTNQWVLVGSKVKGQITDIEASKGFGCPGEDACSSDATPGGLLITEYSEGD